MIRFGTWIGAAVALAVSAAGAAEKPDLKFLRILEVPAIGLKLSLMANYREVPLPPPSAYTYSFSRGEQKWTAEMYAPLQLWQNLQHAGQWVDDHQNSLQVATILSPLPPTNQFRTGHATREEFEKALADTPVPAAWDDPALLQWVSDFSGLKALDIQTVPRTPLRVKELKVFTQRGLSSTLVGYAFRLNRPAQDPSVSNAPSWYFVRLSLNAAIDADRAQRIINEQFIPSLAPIKVTRRTQAASASYQAAGPARRKPPSREFLASRQQVLDSIRNMKDWWYVETENFIILSNLKSQFRVAVKELQHDIEVFRDAFEQCIPPPQAIAAVSVVRIFNSSDEYVNYVGKNFAWSGGVWMPHKKELVIRPLAEGDSKDKRQEIARVAYHESFHQFLFYAFDRAEASPWFNEGHAEFFSSAGLSGRRLTLTENPEHVKEVEMMVAGSPPDLDAMFAMTPEEFYQATDTERKRHYSLAWALVYYLRTAGTTSKNGAFRAILGKYTEALWATRDGRKATEKALEGVNLEELRKDFSDFWKSRNRRGEALRRNLFKAYVPAPGQP